MHIPDGYLGPATCGALYAAMLPIWLAASRIVKKTLQARQIPLMAIGAAFSFVIMMFNVPIPGGTTGHAVGGVLVAILLGPWAAVIAVSVALAVQALLFGDGGITALGANCFNMAFVLPLAGYYTYRLVSRGAAEDSSRRVIAAGAAGYVGINLAALLAGVEFGLQPHLHHTAEGQALYCPYGLKIAVPIMAGEHLLVFGWVEAVVTALVVKYLQKQAPELLERRAPAGIPARLWVLLGILVLLSPLGLILPAYFKAGSAWGEWGPEEIGALAGYIPEGLKKLAGLWNAPLPDYAFSGLEGKGLAWLSPVYILSGLAGAALAVLLAWVTGRILVRSGRDFVGRSIRGALDFFKESIFADETAARPGFLQSLDPRVKAVTVALFILLALFTRSLAVLGLIYLFSLLLAVFSRIGPGFFLKRTLIFIPFFALLIVIPALFSFVSPGRPVLSWGPLVITEPGLRSAGIVLGRVAASVSLAVLLGMTTRHLELLKALRAFGIPRMFVMVLGITYRYIYLFVEIVENTFSAIRSRVGSGIHYRKGQRMVAWNIAHLWIRSYAFNEQVYQAMVSRGFRGEPRALDQFRTRRRDWLWLGGTVIAIILLAYAEFWSRTF